MADDDDNNTDDNGAEPSEGTESTQSGEPEEPTVEGNPEQSPTGQDMDFEDISAGQDKRTKAPDEDEVHSAQDLEPVYDVPVKVQAVLGKSNLEVSQLLKLAPGAVVELDRKVGEAIDIYVNNRLVARGEVVLVEDHLGVTMTEIIKTDAA